MNDAFPPCAANQDDGDRLVLAPTCTLRESLALKAELIERCGLHSDMAIDGSAVERIDTAGLQLLAAFFLDMGARQKSIRWCGASESLRSAARQVGLDGLLGLLAVEDTAG
jgi:phospholipid transport system transporter-binding protein